MAFALVPSGPRWRPGPAAARKRALALGAAALGVLALIAGPALVAQIEGDRGIIPIAGSQDIQVDDVQVETTGATADEARLNGWHEAQRKAWEKIGGPAMPDGQIESMVSAVVVQREQIGPRRYIATLGVIFDRTRAGQYVGAGDGQAHRSAPLLVIPVLYEGGTAQVYEVRGAWQRAWANFHIGASPIDYVRPVGNGSDSLLITAGQPARRSRLWWRNVLDQMGASDVIVPEARLEREWPGGPVHGTFTARYGPDNTWLGNFTMTAPDEASLPKMLAQAVVRIDGMYARALSDGLLKPDPTLEAQRPSLDPALASLIAAADAADRPAAAPTAAPSTAATEAPTQGTLVTIQFASPDAAAVDATLTAVRSVPGVESAATSSLALGGTSVMRVGFSGDTANLAAALKLRGYTVSGGGTSFTIKK
ncbi:heavy-metal-associated domain-containing protein [Parablastomonas sp. CN1-191]|uniref:heavy-metal-associated domain-containing protein n=1 Tax=Parablastomonas sp. CN1-191 TaxID=3400908 RepID=UPI003BF862B0